MATVWRGDDPLLARAVAIKTLDPALAEDDAVRVRFRREAIAAAAVAHPSIVATYDTGEDDGVAYIVMELVEGATLRQAIDLHGALPPARAADIASQVADALAAAHSRGLVHRDVKPSNVLVQLDGRAKVMDFGIAKAADQGHEDLTRAGNVMGTARYVAPEQLEGTVVDERADVYSLGLVLYEMLVGQPPFGADTELATAVARLSAPAPRVLDARPTIPPGLAHIVDRALEREPDRRWPNAAAMRDALAPFRVAAPDRTADATVPVAIPPRDVPRAATATPVIINDGLGVGARVFIWALALVLGFGAGYAGYVLATNDSASDPVTRTGSQVEALEFVSAASFDPEGDNGAENDELAANSIDGQSTTAWETETYRQADVGGKPGVGLVLELAGPARVDSVSIATDTAGYSAAIFVSDSPAEDLADWGPIQADGSDLGRVADLDLAERPTGRYLLVWLTQLPAVDSADGLPSFQGRITEISARGIAR